jgi:hypothetical protein
MRKDAIVLVLLVIGALAFSGCQTGLPAKNESISILRPGS